MVSPITQSNVLHVYAEDFSNPTPTPQDATRVVFVRHGECYNNLKDVMESECSDEHPDVHNGLTLKGKGQASDAGHFLLERTPNVAAIFTSPNMRAQETAKIVTEVFQESEKSTPAITVKQELQEEFFGPMERHTFNEFKTSLDGGNRFVAGVPGVGDVRRGETGDEVKDRVSGLLFNIASDQTFHGKTILCFTHWFPIAQALRISGVAVENLGAYKIANGGCCSFIIKGTI